jgi:hypothetical protein
MRDKREKVRKSELDRGCQAAPTLFFDIERRANNNKQNQINQSFSDASIIAIGVLVDACRATQRRKYAKKRHDCRRRFYRWPKQNVAPRAIASRHSIAKLCIALQRSMCVGDTRADCC